MFSYQNDRYICVGGLLNNASDSVVALPSAAISYFQIWLYSREPVVEQKFSRNCCLKICFELLLSGPSLISTQLPEQMSEKLQTPDILIVNVFFIMIRID